MSIPNAVDKKKKSHQLQLEKGKTLILYAQKFECRNLALIPFLAKNQLNISESFKGIEQQV